MAVTNEHVGAGSKAAAIRGDLIYVCHSALHACCQLHSLGSTQCQQSKAHPAEPESWPASAVPGLPVCLPGWRRPGSLRWLRLLSSAASVASFRAAACMLLCQWLQMTKVCLASS